MFGWVGKAFLKLLGGSRNERLVRSRLQFVREHINPLEPEIRALSDEELLARSIDLKRRLSEGADRDEIRTQAFALTREASRRGQNHRQFDVQLVAGMILDEGKIAEEATGEGKTVACYPAIYMGWLEGLKVHVVTTNDYLVQRDAEFARPIFALLGMTVGYVVSSMPAYGREIQPRREAYQCDVTYGTNSEFGFDYLRDNTKLSVSDQVQSELGFAIIDEVDNILIDEARTPLILSGMGRGRTEQYARADAVARELIVRNRAWSRVNQQVESLQRNVRALEGEIGRTQGDQADKTRKKLQETREELEQAERELSRLVPLYEVELDKKSAHLTDEGVGVAQEIAGVGSFYVGGNMEWPHLMSQSLRAHLVYERDKDYVVQDGQVKIVDEFTGRILEGREWSDGLHQAAEAKERVRIKVQTQVNATVTIQNYFKLYRKLAGMTGTALTEAEEFMKIYSLDSVAVPTHRPVNRVDHEDVIYGEVSAKYEALVEEINRVSKQGRPVLVGTTSIEKSERISDMLQHRFGVDHEVLNGRAENAAREKDIVAKAGQQHPLKAGSKEMVGSVTIATNMAGRGTDIKLGPGVVRDTCRVPEPEELRRLGLEPDPLFPAGSHKCCIHCPQYDASTQCAHCYKPKLDPEFPQLGRTTCVAEVPCGLHIVGTERHEARRIDNQLRGRSGRQGDPGSSRFFLSLRDELMSIFAGEWTLKVLRWLGLQGDVAIEDRRISKGIERAQRKVEERNFEVRKNLLEYDEVMDHQRHFFYSQRQKILEGRELVGLVKEMVERVITEAVESYLDGGYAKRCIVEWATKTLQTPIREERIQADSPEDLASLEEALRQTTREEAAAIISITLGEYIDEDTPEREWDLRGLSAWAMSRFRVSISQNQLRRMSPTEVEAALYEGAVEQIDQIPLGPIADFLEPGVAEGALAKWVETKFGFQPSPGELEGSQEEIIDRLVQHAETVYRRREVEYPVEYIVGMTVGQAGTDNIYALGSLVDWANRKYDASLTVEDLRDRRVGEITARLVELSEAWLENGLLEQTVRETLGASPSVEEAIDFARSRFDTELQPEDFNGDIPGRLINAGRQFLRREMTELERFVLLQIHDQSWIDHLQGMDHLKGSIGLRGYAEQDPRVAFKREGSNLFEETFASVRDKVTDMIFKARLTEDSEMVDVYGESTVVHDQLSAYDMAAQGMEQQAGPPPKVETIVRDLPKVGRNDPCPCGSGKKYKKCCGKGL
jgi:preprotein translocase subunit SecA